MIAGFFPRGKQVHRERRWKLGWAAVKREQILHFHFQNLGELQGERRIGNVVARLDRVNRLAADAGQFGDLRG